MPGLGTLNQAIDDYVANNGDPDLSVKFELVSGGFYIATASIENRFPLRIEAEESARVRPVIRPQGAFRAFRVRDDIVLRGLYITNEDPVGGIEDQVIRISSDGARVVIDDCHIDKATQSALRIDNDGNRIFITNSVISNIGNLSNPSNGRGIDDRGQDIDTLWVENSTFYNLTARLLRDDGGDINYLKWNQTTCVHSGDRSLDMGDALKVEVTNNIFINPAYFGDDERGSTAFQLDSVDINTQDITISHNNFYADPAFLAVYDGKNDTTVSDSVFPREFINGTAQQFIDLAGTNNTMTFNPVPFENAPDAPVAYVANFFQDPGNITNGLDDGNGGADTSALGQLPFNFSIPDTSFACSAGTDGQQIGDTNWPCTPTNVSIDRGLSDRIGLAAFPNPFSTQTTLRFDLAAFAQVNISIFNAIGEKISTVYEGQMNAGTQEVVWETQDVPAGTYFYRMQVDGNITSGKLIRL